MREKFLCNIPEIIVGIGTNLVNQSENNSISEEKIDPHNELEYHLKSMSANHIKIGTSCASQKQTVPKSQIALANAPPFERKNRKTKTHGLSFQGSTQFSIKVDMEYLCIVGGSLKYCCLVERMLWIRRNTPQGQVKYSSIKSLSLNYLKWSGYKGLLMILVAVATSMKAAVINILIMDMQVTICVVPMMTELDNNESTDTHRYAYDVRRIVLIARLQHDNNDSVFMAVINERERDWNNITMTLGACNKLYTQWHKGNVNTVSTECLLNGNLHSKKKNYSVTTKRLQALMVSCSCNRISTSHFHISLNANTKDDSLATQMNHCWFIITRTTYSLPLQTKNIIAL